MFMKYRAKYKFHNSSKKQPSYLLLSLQYIAREEEEERDKDGEVSSDWAMHSLGQYSDQDSTMQYTLA